MKTLVSLCIVLVFFISRVSAQEAWQLIESFEGEGLKQGGVSAIPTLEDKHGNIWFVTNSGSIYQYANQVMRSTENLGCSTPLKQKKLHNEDCFKLFKGPHNELWLTSKNKGISKFIDDHWVDLSSEIGDYDKHINCSLVDAVSNIWFGTNKGLVKYNGESWQVLASQESHPAIEVLEIIEDQSGSIWTVTSENSLMLLKNNEWQQKDLTEIGVAPGDYRTLYADSKNRVWLISQSIVGYFSGNEWISFGNVLDKFEILEMKKVIKSTFYNLDQRLLIQESTDGLIWLAHQNGVSFYDGISWKTYAAGNELPNKWQVHSFYADDDGHIYTGTFKSDGLLYKLGRDQIEKIPIKGEKFMVAIFQDSHSNIWVSGSKGVFKISNGRNSSEVFEKPSMGYMYHDAFEDSRGRIWFGMQGFKSRVLLYTPPGLTN